MASSPSSFHTATSSHDFSFKYPMQHAAYRPAKQLPAELREQIQVYLEEQMYSSAITLLNNLVVAGQSSSESKPAYSPPATHLSLFGTLLVHPIYTTRNSKDNQTIPSHAFVALSNVLHVLGPVNGNLAEAFSFVSQTARSNRRRRNSTDDTFAYDESAIDHILAREGSLWSQAETFWDIVGWSFNCSIQHKERWECWEVWLLYMLEVLDADWNERERLDSISGNEDQEMLLDSILVKYLSLGGRTHTFRRIVRSIFADGSTESLRAFPEIFPNETVKTNSAKRKRAETMEVDIENDKFGDYDEDFDQNPNTVEPLSSFDSFASSQSSPPPSGNDENGNSAKASPASALGGISSVSIRLRLLALLSRASYHFPSEILPIPQLYDLLYESIRPLPLQLFSFFLSPTALAHLPTSMLISLTQLHLTRLLPSSVPTSSQEDDALTQTVLEKCYIPFAAATSGADANARVSICVETLVRVFVASGQVVEGLAAFKAVIAEGVRAREARAVARKRGKAPVGGRILSGEDEVGLRILMESGERLKLLMEALAMRTS